LFEQELLGIRWIEDQDGEPYEHSCPLWKVCEPSCPKMIDHPREVNTVRADAASDPSAKWEQLRRHVSELLEAISLLCIDTVLYTLHLFRSCVKPVPHDDLLAKTSMLMEPIPQCMSVDCPRWMPKRGAASCVCDFSW
jgi:hypothetical protein